MKNDIETLNKIFIVYNLKTIVHRFNNLKEDDTITLSKFEVNALNAVNVELSEIEIEELYKIIDRLNEEIINNN